MSEQLPISVHILTWNSGKTLRRTIESVRKCAEILIIDGGSTDATLSIAQEFGAKIIQQRDREQRTPLQNFSAARNRGLKHTTQPWIFSIDSDEIASSELMEDIEQIVQEGTACACWIPRRYVLPDETIVRHATTYPNERLYFFHRDAVIDWQKPVHERPCLKPGIALKHLQGPSLAPLGTVEDYKRKNLQYLTIEIEKSARSGWGFWLQNRVLRTLFSRMKALVKLGGIWLLPRTGKRLSLHHEMLRFWYAWRLIIDTCPPKARRTVHLSRASSH